MSQLGSLVMHISNLYKNNYSHGVLELWYNALIFFELSIILQIHENNLAINKN
jgi:hypothetical protein